MAKIMKTEYKSHGEPFSSENSQAILQLEPLSNDESLVLNDIFDNCLETDEVLPKDQEEEKSKEIVTMIKTECNTLNEGPQSSVVKSEVVIESTDVQDIESAFKKEPKLEEVFIKEDTTSLSDTVECVSVDYSKTEVSKFMESDSDGEDESNLQIDTSTIPSAPLLNAYHSIKLSYCLNCELTFNKKTEFFDHIFSTHEAFFLRCYYCTQKFSVKQLRTHIRPHIHKELLSNLPIDKALQIIALKCEITCEICGLLFTTVPSLSYNRIQNHLMKHIRVPHKCERCDRVFGGRAPLKKHVLCHQKNSCLDCDKVFTTGKLLKRHLTYHQITPIICEVCGQKFLMKPLYNKHILIHATFECDKCDKKFLTSAKLKAHQANHPVMCNKCNASFRYRIQMLRHQKKKHKTIESEENNDKNEYECMKCMKTFKTMVEYSLHSHL